ncbi:hypothetical protein AB8Z38_07310 [Bradyrhizobium sp. LLZ17]|uniref:Porin n=1 Tax=Bradyrhizobium sp. LLZ17 TaxID=3239388 RepID=A0AB39XNA5_9BRAD
MRAIVLSLIAFAAASAATAETLRLPPADQPQASKTLPLKGASGAARANACASYGQGFSWVEATGTCVKIGGSTSVDAGVRR